MTTRADKLRARGVAQRAQAVNGVTLADLQAQGVYRNEAARRMGWSLSKILQWEKDTGLKFRRATTREDRSRIAAAAVTEEYRAKLSEQMRQPERIAKSRAALNAIWSDPERKAEVIRRRVETWKANPEAVAIATENLMRHKEAQAEAMRAFFADEASWGKVKAQMAARARERNADTEYRKRVGKSVSEAHRRRRVERGLAALDAGTLTEQEVRRLIRDMTGEERMIWMMKRDAKAARKRMRA